jgi:hypothetical protein
MDINVRICEAHADGSLLTIHNDSIPAAATIGEVLDSNAAKILGCDDVLRASHRVSREVVETGFPW